MRNPEYRIDIEGLKVNEGSFSSNYVSVIWIDDGRFFIDYHYNDHPVCYGPGRLFSHSHIDGVTYHASKYIAGGKDHLSIVAIYDVSSEEEAKSIFSKVLDAYTRKYPGQIITNKNLEKKKDSKKKEIKTKPKKIRKAGIRISNGCFEQFPLKDGKIQRFSLDIESFEIFEKVYSCNLDMFYRSIIFSDVIDYHEIKKIGGKSVIRGYASLRESYFEATIRFTIPSSEEFRTIFFRSEAGMFQKEVQKGYRDYVVFFNSLMMDPDSDFVQDVRDLEKLLSIITADNLQIIADDQIFLIDDVSLQSIILLIQATLYVLNDRQKQYDTECRIWYSHPDEYFLDYLEAKRISKVTADSFSTQEKKAVVNGSNGEKYMTTLESCSCMDFQRRELQHIFYRPCKHMFWLAQRIGIADFNVLPKRPDYKDDPIVEKILEHLNGNKPHLSSDFRMTEVEGWQKPLLSLSPQQFRVSEISKKYSKIPALYFNRHNIITDDGRDSFVDAHNGKVFFEGKCIGDFFYDSLFSERYKISSSATELIYSRMLEGKDISFFINIDGKSYEQYIPCVHGFAEAYCFAYPDAIERYNEMINFDENNVKRYSELYGMP